MGYTLEAYLGSTAAIDVLGERLAGKTTVRLRSGVSMLLGGVPFQAGTDRVDVDALLDGRFEGLTIACVLAEYFGGSGTWFFRDGTLRWSMVDDDTKSTDRDCWPINRALAELRTQTSRTAWSDCFEEIGLGHCRSNERWEEFVAAGGTGETITARERERAEQGRGSQPQRREV